MYNMNIPTSINKQDFVSIGDNHIVFDTPVLARVVRREYFDQVGYVTESYKQESTFSKDKGYDKFNEITWYKLSPLGVWFKEDELENVDEGGEDCDTDWFDLELDND